MVLLTDLEDLMSLAPGLYQPEQTELKSDASYRYVRILHFQFLPPVPLLVRHVHPDDHRLENLMLHRHADADVRQHPASL